MDSFGREGEGERGRGEREICIYQGEGVIRGVGRGVPSKTWKPNPLNQLLLQNRQCAVMLVKQHSVTCQLESIASPHAHRSKKHAH